MSIDDYNYYMDPRTQAGAYRRPYHLELDDVRMTAQIALPDEVDDEPAVAVGTYKFEYEVCDMCRGRGTVMDPIYDASGFVPQSRQDLEEYLSIPRETCPECQGKRVVPQIDWSSGDSAFAARVGRLETQERAFVRMCAMERAMGC